MANQPIPIMGPELAEIMTEGLGYQTIAGEAKLQLIPTAWPADQPPPPTASLLAVASQKGLLAAAGPTGIVIASTEAVRTAFLNSDGGNDKVFNAQLSLNLGMRISQVAFSSNEDYLVLSAEDGGGLAVYEVANLLQNNTATAFELTTNGVALRSLAANPEPTTANLFAIVTNNGDLMIADLKTRQFKAGLSGQVLKMGVSTVTWSKKGKQLIAGLIDGSCAQLTPDGQMKALIPAPDQLGGPHFVSAINWLENDIFLLAHTSPDIAQRMIPPTLYHIITRTKANLTYQKLPEVCPPFGLPRTPAYQFSVRLREFPPNLKDLIIVASTASPELGTITCSTTSLATGMSSAAVETYTTTQMADDSRRAQLPTAGGMVDTSPIGMALDLSSHAPVRRPLPKEEINESAGPLPLLMVLNNEGKLMAWWVIYTDSIRGRSSFPGMVRAQGSIQQPFAAASSVNTMQTPNFGQTGFAQTSPSMTPTVASANAASNAFGASAIGPGTFGAPSMLGKAVSPWANPGSGTTQSNNASTSSSAPNGAIFGAATNIGIRSSPWGSASPGNTASTFGQASTLGASQPAFGSTFGSPTSTPAIGGAFASFASKPSGFVTVAPSNQNGSVLGGLSDAPIASSSGQTSIFGAPSSTTLFGAPSETKGAFSSSNGFDQLASSAQANPSFGSFKMESTFHGTPDTDQGGPKQNIAESSLFGGNFASALGTTSNHSINDDDMIDDNESAAVAPSTTSKDLPPPQSVDKRTPSHVSANSSLVKEENKECDANDLKQDDYLQEKQPSSKPEKLTTSGAITTPVKKSSFHEGDISPLNEEESKPPLWLLEQETQAQSSTPKMQPKEVKQQFESPLPPESTSKAEFAAGDSSTSSKASNDTATVHNRSSAANATADIKQKSPTPKEVVNVKQASSTGSKLTFGAPSVLTARATTSPPSSPGPKKTPREGSEVDCIEDSRTAVGLEPPEEHAYNGGHDGEESEENNSEDDEDETNVGDGDVEHDEFDGCEDVSGSEDEDDISSNDVLDGEGSGVDVADEISQRGSNETTPDNTFVKLDGKSSPTDIFTKTSDTEGASLNRSLFGEVSNASQSFFPVPESSIRGELSPSPIRRPATEELRYGSPRSASSPGFTRLSAVARLTNVVSIPRAQYSKQSFAERQSRSRARQREQHVVESQPLVHDDEEEQMHRLLYSEVEPSKTLDEFIAHQDYIGPIEKPGIPGQIEKIYRDINSMVDTVGLNSRSLVAFVKGQAVGSIEQGLVKVEELDKSLDDWSLSDIAIITSTEAEASTLLKENKLGDVVSILAQIAAMHKDLNALRRRSNDLALIIELRQDPSAITSARYAPLSLVQQTQQSELRKSFKRLQTNLAKAEEGISLLRAKIAHVESESSTSAQQVNGPNYNRRTSTQPTIEAIGNTIRKITSMVERKSSDVEQLESLMLALNVTGSHYSPTPSPQRFPSLALGSSSPQSRFSPGPPRFDQSQSLRRSILAQSTLGAQDPASPLASPSLSRRRTDDGADIKAQSLRRQALNQIMKEKFFTRALRIRELE